MSGVTTGLPVMSPPAARRGQVLVAEDDVRLGRLLAQSLTKADRTPLASIPEQRRDRSRLVTGGRLCHCATTNFVPDQAPINSAHLSQKMFHTRCGRFIQPVTWPAIDPGTNPSPQTCYGAIQYQT
jgi:hypothetical protein